jgi:ankyrin repeat protein
MAEEIAAESPGRCTADGCKKWCVVGGGEFCPDHRVKDQIHSAAGPLDQDPKWHTLDKLSATPTQSQNAVFVHTAAGTYLVKSDTSTLQELFAGQLARALGIRAPQMRILTFLDKEWMFLMSAMAAFAGSVKQNEMVTATVTHRLGQVVLLMEFIPGVRMLTGENAAPATEVLGDTQNLRHLGKIIAFDMLINNTDRFPVVWDNEGNLGNLLFDESGAIVAIDQMLIAIDSENENPLLQKYLDRVDGFLAKVCGAASADAAAPALKPIQDFIRQATGFDVLEAGCVCIAEGVRETVDTISQITPAHLSAIHEHVIGVLPGPVLRTAIQDNSLEIIDLGFLERTLSVFHRHAPAAAAAAIEWPLSLLPAPEIDEKAARELIIQMIQETTFQHSALKGLTLAKLAEWDQKRENALAAVGAPQGAAADLTATGAPPPIVPTVEQTLARQAVVGGKKRQVEDFVDAASVGDIDTLVKSLQDGVPIHAVNGMGVTALGNAAMAGQLAAVKVLLEHGVTEGVLNENSLLEMEALPRACAGGYLEVVKALMAAGFVDKSSVPKATTIELVVPPLVAASRNGKLGVVEFLLEAGIDPNYSKGAGYGEAYGNKGSGETPLCAAAERGYFAVVKALVTGGADVNKAGKHGDTPHSLSKRFKHTDILAFLEEHGAKATAKKKLDVGKFANLGLKLGGPSSVVAESRDKGQLTRD